MLFGDAAIAPQGPFVDVVTAAKIDLEAGQQLDGLGEFMTYGLGQNSDVAERESLLPIGLAEGCRLTRDAARDEVLTYSDVELPEGRVSDRLRAEPLLDLGRLVRSVVVEDEVQVQPLRGLSIDHLEECDELFVRCDSPCNAR